jgi:nitrite reductase/ring-hydroxylating ferredoxin subunit
VNRLRACLSSELKLGDAVVVSLSPHRNGRPREAVVVRDLGGAPHAWLNLCKHLPVPLDAGAREFFDYSGQALLCGTHGALFDLGTGYCFDGPCTGQSLDELDLVDEDGTLYVLDAGDTDDA